MLGLHARLQDVTRPHLRDLLLRDPEGEDIRTADHCYGCTAGQGSSCGGALESALQETQPQEAVLRFAPAGVL